MYKCKHCGSIFSDPMQYNPENVPDLRYEDYDLWGDYENEECCPYCLSLDLISIREDDE